MPKTNSTEKAGKTFSTFIDVIRGSEPATEIDVLPTGSWNTEKYGPMEITEQQVDRIIENFEMQVRAGVPVDIDHDAGAAAGWVKKLTKTMVDGAVRLRATVEWTEMGMEKLKKKIYRFFSPEFSYDHIDPETGTHWGPVLLAGTLTNRPLFKELAPLVAHELPVSANEDLTHPAPSFIMVTGKTLIHNAMLNLADVRTKAAADLTADEKSFIKEHRAELTDDEKKKFSEVIGNDEPEDDKDTPSATPNPTPAPAATPPVSGSEETHTLKASEVKEMREAAEAGRKASEEMRTIKATEKAESFLASEDGGTGRVLPKAKDALVKLVLSMNPEQVQLFDEIMANVPDAKYFEERGRNAKTELGDATKKFMEAVDKIKADEKVAEDKAIVIAQEKHPDLYKAYEAEVESKGTGK